MSPFNASHLPLAGRIAALVALVTAIALAVALTGNEPAQSAAPQTSAPTPSDPSIYVQPPAAVVEAREADFARDFSILREQGGDSIPGTAVIRDAALDVGASRQLSTASARRLAGEDAEQPDATVWVTPRADGTQCLLAQLPEQAGPVTTCATPEQAVDGYFVMTLTPDADHVELYGLMPDGVDAVTVTLADGTTSELPVVDNAYLAQFDQATSTISWHDADGVEHALNAGSNG